MLRLLLGRPTTTIITTTCPIGSRADGMPSFFSRHLHGLLIWADRGRNKKHSPQCCKAIGHLQDVSKREIGPTTYKNRLRRLQFERARAATGARDATTGARDLRIANSSRVALWRAKDKIKELASKLETFHSSKSSGSVICELDSARHTHCAQCLWEGPGRSLPLGSGLRLQHGFPGERQEYQGRIS